MCDAEFETENNQKLTCRPTCAQRHEAMMRGDIVPCPICGKMFIQIKIRGQKQRTCSGSCGAKLRSKSDTRVKKGMGSLPPIVLTCAECGKEFVNKSRRKSRKYCSRKCGAKATAGAGKGWVPSPEWRAKVSERMTKNNPVHRPGVREKIEHTIDKVARADHLRKVRGGNGQRTKPQLLLHERLGWPMEHPISTGNPKWPAAVPDLANPTLKIAIECDGSSHYGKTKRESDKTKDRMLVDLGWSVLRFKNKKVLEQTDQVLQEIEQVVRSQSSR
jgi:hypothetical protein